MNTDIYEKLANTPKEACRPINAGRLKGMTDINPMWRIKKLTETFGACGIGWWTIITDKRIIDGANGEKIAEVDIDLYYKWNGEVSQPVQGTGGAMFVANEKNGVHTSDECFKMAYTDAISVACKLLGMSSDIYYANDKTKYTTEAPKETAKPETIGAKAANEIIQLANQTATNIDEMCAVFGKAKVDAFTPEDYRKAKAVLLKKVQKNAS